MKKSFLGLSKPRLEYENSQSLPTEANSLAVPRQVTLFLEKPHDPKGAMRFAVGDSVTTGQKIALYEDSDAYVIASVTGTIRAISSYVGDFGRRCTAITIQAAEAEQTDTEGFAAQADETGPQVFEQFLSQLPGKFPFHLFSDPEKPIKTLVICGVDPDLLVSTHGFAMKTQGEAISQGISLLKKALAIKNVVLALPQSLSAVAGNIGGASGTEIRVVEGDYPSALPPLILRDVLGQILPAGQSPEDMGYCFVGAEAVAAVGQAFGQKQIPVEKTLTLIRKDLSRVMVKARIGTPLSEIFNQFDVTLADRDRIIVGGPMTGTAVYSEDHPVEPDTDAVMVQDSADVPLVSDYPCINCGECVRICPADIAVNMLVRLIEAGQYEEAADSYDLYSCIECGLCSFVCVAKMPIFQYIRLAKYELGRMKTAEEEADA